MAVLRWGRAKENQIWTLPKLMVLVSFARHGGSKPQSFPSSGE